MCGIAAIYRRDGGPVEPADLERMLSAIAHRGPDDAGYTLLDRGALGLAHVRLSIIDLATGDQPLFDPERDTAIVFNGELYDHAQHRRELEARGHRFTTTSDTEVLLHLYGEHGERFVDRLNGEFAFVIWDGRSRRLLAGRDPLGIKPLYLRESAGELLFASEVKGLYALPRVPRAIAPEYLTSVFVGACPETACAFADVVATPPGTLLVWDAGQPRRERRYWRPPLDQPALTLDRAEAGRELRRHLTEAVRRRLIADVPVHVYLSGGVDSTLVLALMTQLGARPTAYHIAFPGSELDESTGARAVAEHFGAPFDAIPCTMDRLADALEDTVVHVEGAVSNLNSAAKLLLSRHVRSRGTKVCLTGEGADESFAGYQYFKLEALWRMIEAGGAEAERGRALFARFRTLEARTEGLHWDGRDRWKTADRPFGYPSFWQLRVDEVGPMARWMFPLGRLGLGREQLPPAMLRRLFPPAEMRRLAPMNAARAVSFQALSGYILPSLADRVEMASSIECRPPFLDRDVLDFACRLPPELLIDLDRLREKWLLHDAFAELLPDVVKRGHKHPIMSPSWGQFARTSTGRALIGDHLSWRAVERAGLFRPGFVLALRQLWKLAPARSSLGQRLDLAMGAMLSMQILHDRLVARAAWPTRALGVLHRRDPGAASRLTG